MFKKNFNSTMHDAQKKMQKHAMALAKNKNISLGYGEDSIGVLDELVREIAIEIKHEGLETEVQLANHPGVKGIVEAFACYVVECIERETGKGEWVDVDPETGDPATGFILKTGTIIFPIDWIFKKIVNPDGYSIKAVYTQYVT
jgi:hypothetical protein